jgi:hypothetical protein
LAKGVPVFGLVSSRLAFHPPGDRILEWLMSKAIASGAGVIEDERPIAGSDKRGRHGGVPFVYEAKVSVRCYALVI